MIFQVKKQLENREKTAQIIGNSHLIINDFMKPRIKDYEFTWQNVLSIDASGYTLHYAHARLNSLIERSQQELNINLTANDINFKILDKPIELILIQHLAKYHEVVWKSYVDYEPYYLVDYLFQLVYDQVSFDLIYSRQKTF